MNNIDQELSFVAISDEEANTIQGGSLPLLLKVAYWVFWKSSIPVS